MTQIPRIWGEILAGARSLFLAFAASTPVFAHGGQYSGPSSTPPPPKPQAPSPGSYGGPTDTGGSGRGPATPGPRAPSGPTPPTGGVPAPGAGTRGGSGVTTGFYDVSQDLSRWEKWWELNQHSLLDLRGSLYAQGPSTGTGADATAIDRLRPNEAELRERVLPKLLFLMRHERNADLQTGAIMALAKIGLESRISSEFATSIADPNQEVAETATLGLGLLGDARALPALLSLARDDAQGRSFAAKSAVPVRTRAFAIYACGLFGERTDDLAARAKIVETLRGIQDDALDIQAARLVALGSVRDPERRAAEDLRRILEDRKIDARVRAMAPMALARLLGDGTTGAGESTSHPTLAPVRESVLRILSHTQETALLRLSCIQALPHFACGADAEFLARALQALVRTLQESKSGEERQLAAIALGKWGGPEAEATLSKQLARSSGTIRPWAALGLGLLGRAESSRREPIGESLRAAFEAERNPSTAAAIAIAMGLNQDRVGVDLLRARLDTSANEELRGYLALALGMMGAREALPQIAKIAEEAVRRPELQKQSVMALGLLGDRAVGVDLVQRLGAARTLAAQATLASAIGWIGDRRSLDPLLALLDGEKITPLGRAFVAAALGMIGDPRGRPWNASMAADLNYFAAPPTLLDPAGLNGLLDIL